MVCTYFLSEVKRLKCICNIGNIQFKSFYFESSIIQVTIKVNIIKLLVNPYLENGLCLDCKEYSKEIR